MSPYGGSMYHGSPLLLSVLGPLTVKRIEGQPDHVLCSLLFVIADIMSAMLIRGISWKLHMAYRQSLKALNIINLPESSDALASGDIAALMCLWNPFTTVACVGLSTSPIENLFIILTLYGACAYAPPQKLFLQKGCYKIRDNSSSDVHCKQEKMINQLKPHIIFFMENSRAFLFLDNFLVTLFVGSMWYLVCLSSSIVACGRCFKELMVEDMSPNIGVLWYFFAEVFNFFRNFFLIIFHINILFMILPLAIRLNHRPCFLAFSCIAILSMLKPYPSKMVKNDILEKIPLKLP
ncbi:phosphatidylinositol glycan anchor biosynthesis class U protein isoform X2 [Manihot esculenta]|uniref:phosphatidylinositol glycan anchor biosynthesis class U protein isoform X2 n=1 Tax=Manihot esculenta TaxID=3983 RepID=UPI001CC46B6F|nr:phosphatidylinositol glycan anchor biosynthesis class U protein isoform X2 [Manihot esculenta]